MPCSACSWDVELTQHPQEGWKLPQPRGNQELAALTGFWGPQPGRFYQLDPEGAEGSGWTRAPLSLRVALGNSAPLEQLPGAGACDCECRVNISTSGCPGRCSPSLLPANPPAPQRSPTSQPSPHRTAAPRKPRCCPTLPRLGGSQRTLSSLHHVHSKPCVCREPLGCLGSGWGHRLQCSPASMHTKQSKEYIDFAYLPIKRGDLLW